MGCRPGAPEIFYCAWGCYPRLLIPFLLVAIMLGMAAEIFNGYMGRTALHPLDFRKFPPAPGACKPQE